MFTLYKQTNPPSILTIEQKNIYSFSGEGSFNLFSNGSNGLAEGLRSDVEIARHFPGQDKPTKMGRHWALGCTEIWSN